MDGKRIELNIHPLTRVEGHGRVYVKVKNGMVEEITLDVVESPRFFEAIVRGYRFDEVPHIVSRICGICAISHTLASIKAIEDAFGVEVSPQSELLRRLALHGETVQSHILHIFFLVLPDLFRVTDFVPLLKTHPEMLELALKVKGVANRLCETIAGRHIHPITFVVGGVAYLPERKALLGLKEGFKKALGWLDTSIKSFQEKGLPSFERKREYISLGGGGYPFYKGDVVSSLGYSFKGLEYRERIEEVIVPPSTAKHSMSLRAPKHRGEATLKGPYMVGALARLNNNLSGLKPIARKAFERLGMGHPSFNPFHNNLTQLIESIHCIEEGIEIIEVLLDRGLKKEEASIKPRTLHNGGRGVGIVEAPRGTLYHEYVFDDNGHLVEANCVIPTQQNLLSIKEDLWAYLGGRDYRDVEALRYDTETLIRAYDPCISCSAHIIEL